MSFLRVIPKKPLFHVRHQFLLFRRFSPAGRLIPIEINDPHSTVCTLYSTSTDIIVIYSIYWCYKWRHLWVGSDRGIGVWASAAARILPESVLSERAEGKGSLQKFNICTGSTGAKNDVTCELVLTEVEILELLELPSPELLRNGSWGGRGRGVTAEI